MADSKFTLNLPPGMFRDGEPVLVTIKPTKVSESLTVAWKVVNFATQSQQSFGSLPYLKSGGYTVTLSDSDSFFLAPEASFTLIVHATHAISAGVGDDDVHGSTGDDTLSGGSGADCLYGGEGSDILRGGSGKDIFVFDTTPNKKTNLDRIVDFNVNDDSIWLDNAVFTKLGKKGTPDHPAPLKKDFFTIGDKAKDKNDYIVYDDKKGILYYDQDGSGSKAAIEIAKLDKNLKMTNKDFFVV
ncbi:M10 family metallopeptidase C-terminal domain-containing protein [Microvirga zambiensis]|uniref:M10 family metallopeptidase C-terminal domain-containing protein n=1 Tax=Microvirga zambiensis TaxID=1402137 RepID=UPI00191E70C2|nr:calcium-binding protein [Microvirga zambiensis]